MRLSLNRNRKANSMRKKQSMVIVGTLVVFALGGAVAGQPE
jgi:uncharacterized ion transporter superfamily protein YfcC